MVGEGVKEVATRLDESARQEAWGSEKEVGARRVNRSLYYEDWTRRNQLVPLLKEDLNSKALAFYTGVPKGSARDLSIRG